MLNLFWMMKQTTRPSRKQAKPFPLSKQIFLCSWRLMQVHCSLHFNEVCLLARDLFIIIFFISIIRLFELKNRIFSFPSPTIHYSGHQTSSLCIGNYYSCTLVPVFHFCEDYIVPLYQKTRKSMCCRLYETIILAAFFFPGFSHRDRFL